MDRKLNGGEMLSLKKKGSETLPVKSVRQRQDAESEEEREVRLNQQREIDRG